jgi:rhodanese-related sulfurtransferase
MRMAYCPPSGDRRATLARRTGTLEHNRTMPTSIICDQVQELLEQGAQLIDVLPADEFEALHLPGAINIPLKTLGPDAVAALRREAPTIVYCFDGL